MVSVAPLLAQVKDRREYLKEVLEAREAELWRWHEWTGRPLGEAFLESIERALG